MAEEIVATREAFGIEAALNGTIMGDFSRSLLHVLSLMTIKVFGVKESLTTVLASVRALVTAKVDLDVTAGLC